jgi:hypothetical protein
MLASQSAAPLREHPRGGLCCFAIMSENRQLGSWSRNLKINGWRPTDIPGSFSLSLQVIA